MQVLSTIAAGNADQVVRRSRNISETWLYAFIERFIRSIKEECLYRVIPLSETHLRELIREYKEHYGSGQCSLQELVAMSVDCQ